ncbi:hypothetical protein EKN29_07430 [Enterobacter mori]|uniref:Uncharacterized protein n=1 Tax=Enterobacter mori TaxID=539813 RepID=A0A9Q7NUM3_9ENTR|nr:hypothetical protein EKN29_07430 [Enterobacter mori]
MHISTTRQARATSRIALRCRLIIFASNIHEAYLIGRRFFGNAKAVKKCLGDKRFALSCARRGRCITAFRRCWQSRFYTIRSSSYGNGTCHRCRRRACSRR